MKLCNEYWYKHSATNTHTHPSRSEVIKSTGLFVVDGGSVSRESFMTKGKTLIWKDSQTRNIFQSTEFSRSPFVPHKSIETTNIPQKSAFGPDSNRNVLVRKFSPDKYYNRFKTPKPELEELLSRQKRKNRIEEFKHVYFDDNYVQRPVCTVKSGSILFPSNHSINSFNKMINCKVSPED
jgi:hypothetical protein